MPLYKNAPSRHTVIAVGYGGQTDKIIVHDPIYSSGDYVYIPSNSINKALRNYESGIHMPHQPQISAMLSTSHWQQVGTVLN